MLHVKKIYMIIAGVSILVVSIVLAIVPRYLEISRLSEEFEEKLSKLEEAYRRYVNQKSALEELRVVMREPPRMESLEVDSLRIEKTDDGFSVRGKTDGVSLMRIMDEVMRNPSAYFEEINLLNSVENPITISGSTKSEADVSMKIRILELRE